MVLASLPWTNVKLSLDEIVSRRPAWQRDALCSDYRDVTFFPAPGESTAPAKAVCARCSVREVFLEYAIRRRAIPRGRVGRDVETGTTTPRDGSCRLVAVAAPEQLTAVGDRVGRARVS